jgi:hypothetical protein
MESYRGKATTSLVSETTFLFENPDATDQSANLTHCQLSRIEVSQICRRFVDGNAACGWPRRASRYGIKFRK